MRARRGPGANLSTPRPLSLPVCVHHISSPSHHTHSHTNNAPSHTQQEYRYLSSIAVKDGKVFALFVRSPARAFGRNEADLRHIIETFELL